MNQCQPQSPSPNPNLNPNPKQSPYLKFKSPPAETKIVSMVLQQMLAHNEQITIRGMPATEVGQLCQGIEEWRKTGSLLIGGCAIGRELYQLAGILFTDLRELNLFKNKIESIEALADLRAPNLDTLVLSQNYISTVKPLRRLNCPQLDKIYIMNNQVRDWEALCELPCIGSWRGQEREMGSEGKQEKRLYMLEKISMDWKDESSKCQDISFIAKMGGIHQASRYSKNIIRQYRVEGALAKIDALFCYE